MTTTHPIHLCDPCAQALESAEAHARATGSVGATVEDDRTRVGGEIHRATWERPTFTVTVTVPEWLVTQVQAGHFTAHAWAAQAIEAAVKNLLEES